MDDVPSELLTHLPSDGYIPHGPSHRPNVAVTIDDWWWTTDILQYLETTLDLARHHDARLTFFPVGGALRDAYNARRTTTRHLWQRAVAEGHVIGNHTQTHHLMGRMPASEIKWNLSDQRRWLDLVLGSPYREHLMRPPGGDGGFPSQGAMFDHTLGVVRDLGYYMTMWSIDSNAPDGSIVTPNEDARFLAKIYREVRNGSIILVHPTTLSVNGLASLLRGLRDRGYTMVTVPDLFAPPEYWTTG